VIEAYIQMTAKPTRKSAPEPDAVSLAVQLLAKELRRRIQRHPSAHLLNGRDSVEVQLRLPTLDREGWVDEVSQGVSESIDQALSRLLIHRSVFRLGHVYCLRCASANCEHTTPNHCNEVFAGYSPSGLPRFQDLGQWLLEQQNPRVDQLYRSPHGLVAQITPGSVLTRSLLPAFQDADSGYHIHGQVAAGWYSFPTLDGLTRPVALTFQIVSTQPQRGRRRVGLNLIGLGPENEPLENLFDRAGEIPWLGATRWVEGILRDVERSLTRRKRPSEDAIEKRLDGLLSGLARRLEHQRRSRDRRTRHGQERHGDRDRPTEMAFSDLERARNEDILFDTRRQTLIVIGDRGRAHVFNDSGRLVTSIRYSPTSIARRRKKELWKPATDDQIGALRKQVSLTREEEA
jgi:hypothetical protein